MTLIEVKSGRVNAELIAYVRENAERPPSAITEEVRSTRGSVAADQVARILRQEQRLDDVIELLNTNRGRGIEGAEVRLSDDVQVLHTFTQQVHGCLDALRANPNKLYAIALVEECAFVGAYRGAMSSGAVLKAWMEALGADGPIVDVVGGLFLPHTPPLFAEVSDWEHLSELLAGRVRLFVGIDFNRLIEIAAEQGFTLEWQDSKWTRRMRSQQRGLLEWRGRALAACAQGANHCLVGEGIVARIAYGFTLPSHATSILDPRKRERLTAAVQSESSE